MTTAPKIFACLLGLSVAPAAVAVNTWNYQQDRDRINNQTITYTTSPLPRRDLYDDLHVEVYCQGQKLQVVLSTENIIASQGSQFELAYQVDNNPPITLPMQTFPDSKRKGFNDSDAALRMINDIIAGKEMLYLRLTTTTKKALSAGIPLDNASEVINKVLDDCHAGTPAANNAGSSAAESYSVEKFVQDFSQLPAERQKPLLDKLQKLVSEAR